MPGRNDFGILKARALGDPRVLRAAERYVEAKIAREETSLPAVLGHLSMLGLWLAINSDDGVLPGDGVATVCAATLSSPFLARKIIAILREPDVDLLTSEGVARERACICAPTCAGACARGPFRLRGFDDAYGPLLQARETNRTKAKRWRRKQLDVPSNVTGDVPSDVARHVTGSRTGPYRTEENPPLPPTAGGCPPAAANGHGEPLTDAERAMAGAVIDCLARHVGCDDAEQRFGFEMRKAIRDGLAEACDVREMIAKFGPRKGIRESVGLARNIARESA